MNNLFRTLLKNGVPRLMESSPQPKLTNNPEQQTQWLNKKNYMLSIFKSSVSYQLCEYLLLLALC